MNNMELESEGMNISNSFLHPSLASLYIYIFIYWKAILLWKLNILNLHVLWVYKAAFCSRLVLIIWLVWMVICYAWNSKHINCLVGLHDMRSRSTATFSPVWCIYSSWSMGSNASCPCHFVRSRIYTYAS
jgi:hypothetical protein